MKKIIKFIIDKKLNSIDDYPTLAQPIADVFKLDVGVAEAIINVVYEWETSNTVDSIEEILVKKFPSIVT